MNRKGVQTIWIVGAAVLVSALVLFGATAVSDVQSGFTGWAEEILGVGGDDSEEGEEDVLPGSGEEDPEQQPVNECTDVYPDGQCLPDAESNTRGIQCGDGLVRASDSTVTCSAQDEYCCIPPESEDDAQEVSFQCGGDVSDICSQISDMDLCAAAPNCVRTCEDGRCSPGEFTCASADSLPTPSCSSVSELTANVQDGSGWPDQNPEHICSTVGCTVENGGGEFTEGECVALGDTEGSVACEDLSQSSGSQDPAEFCSDVGMEEGDMVSCSDVNQFSASFDVNPRGTCAFISGCVWEESQEASGSDSDSGDSDSTDDGPTPN